MQCTHAAPSLVEGCDSSAVGGASGTQRGASLVNLNGCDPSVVADAGDDRLATLGGTRSLKQIHVGIVHNLQQEQLVARVIADWIISLLRTEAVAVGQLSSNLPRC